MSTTKENRYASALVPSVWAGFRQQMPVVRRWNYLDHAAVAPLPAAAQAALSHWATAAAEHGDTAWPDWANRVEQVRHRIAQLIGADSDEIALVGNTTQGIGIVAAGLPWQSGDNIVTLANEFPTNLYPWLNLGSLGVETRRVPVGEDGRVVLDLLQAACDRRTRLISVSWVSYLTGWRVDLDELVELAHRQDALLMVDAIQGLGVFPLDVHRTPVDFVAADGHKWLLGPEGAGLLYVRRELIPRLRPTGVGWHSAVEAHEFRHDRMELRADAARWEGGSANMPGLHALGASLDLLASLGLSSTSSPLADRVLELNAYAAQRLTTLGAQLRLADDPKHRSGIVSFQLPGCDPKIVRRHCLDAGIALSVRADWLRISPHAYNDEAEIERLVAVLAAAR